MGLLARQHPAAAFDRVRDLFLELQAAWGNIPFDVVNDGEISKRGLFTGYIRDRMTGFEAEAGGPTAQFRTLRKTSERRTLQRRSDFGRGLARRNILPTAALPLRPNRKWPG